MNHTPFIIAAYAFFAVLVAIDVMTPWLQRRQWLRDLKGRLQRQQRREETR